MKILDFDFIHFQNIYFVFYIFKNSFDSNFSTKKK